MEYKCKCGKKYKINPSRKMLCICGKWFDPRNHVPECLPTVLNCIYHVYATRINNGWEQNLEKLEKYASIFNGKRFCTISCDSNTVSYNILANRLERLGFKCYETPNDKVLREVLTFPLLLAAVQSTDPSEATFYAHTKGNTTADSVRGSIYWRNMMYRELLGGYEKCIKYLTQYKAVGTHKMVWPKDHVAPYPAKMSPMSKLQKYNWMFAGTFFWFRSFCVFNNENWRHIPTDRYGAESWLSGLFEASECKSVYQLWDENTYPTVSPYDPDIYPEKDREL